MRNFKLRPKFSLRMLAVVVTTIVCGVWWVIWPSKVAEEVTQLLNERNFTELSPKLATTTDRDFLNYLAYVTKHTPNSDPEAFSTMPRDRTWSEILRGRQQFVLGFHFEVVVERGRVSFLGTEGSGGLLEEKKQRDKREQEFYEQHPDLRTSQQD